MARDYEDEYMLEHGAMTVMVEFLWKQLQKVEPKDPSDYEKELIAQFLEDDTDDWDWNEEGDEEAEAFRDIRWKFTKEARKNYLDVPVLGNITE